MSALAAPVDETHPLEVAVKAVVKAVPDVGLKVTLPELGGTAHVKVESTVLKIFPLPSLTTSLKV